VFMSSPTASTAQGRIAQFFDRAKEGIQIEV
jgi:hypothetical protein